MASFKLHLARVKGCPPAKQLAELMTAFGTPDTEEFGVLNCSSTSTTCYATILRKTQVAVNTLDEETKEVTTSAVEKITLLPVAITPIGRLEVYAGAASAIEQVGIFLSSCLALKTVTERIEMDVVAAVERLAGEMPKFQLRSLRVSDFSADAYMTGGYGPTFLDTEHGLKFANQYAEGILAATCRYAGPTGRVTVTLRPDACVGYSCNEDDQTAVQVTIRKLIGDMTLCETRDAARQGGRCTSMTLSTAGRSVTLTAKDADALRSRLEGGQA